MKSGVIILSGGKSSRMGTNKALLPIEEKPNIARIKEELETKFKEMILITNEPDSYEFLQIPTVSDKYPGFGPLAGIHAGLLASNQEVNLIIACDMPFVSAGIGTILVENIEGYDAVVPVINGMKHPLFAVYHKRILPIIEESLLQSRLRIKHVLDQINTLYVSEKELQKQGKELEHIFFNMNHPEEYEHAKKWAEK
jgi:molybdenum cofactor guanylyltransferase